jgi:hypothetical protein
MDINNLSEADKYLLYGLLLKKPRSGDLDRKALNIARSGRSLDEKIEAILDLQGEPEERGPRARAGGTPGSARVQGGDSGTPRRRTKRRGSALVIDVYPEVTRLLGKCSLKRALSFTRVGESLDALFLLRKLDVRLLVINETVPAEECARYYEICRAIEPQVRIIYLLPPSERRGGSQDYQRHTRFIPKPINIDLLDRTARDLLGL